MRGSHGACRALARVRGRRAFFTFPTDDLRVYTVGEAWLSNAGLPEDAVATAPALVPLIREHPAVSLDVGWGHAAVVTAGGAAVLLGRPHDFRNTLRHINTRGGAPWLQRLMAWVGGQLFRADSAPETLPPPGEGDGHWVGAVCSTAAATALLTSTGALYTLGHNFYGQTGSGLGYGVGELPIAYAPVRVVGFPPGERVVQVAVGFEHMLAVTSTGALYTWGRGDRGQLGLGDTESYKQAVRVLGPVDAFLPEPPAPAPTTTDGGVAAPDAAAAAADASALPPHARVVAVEAGVSQSACVTADGRLWVWGKMQATTPKPGSERKAAAIVLGVPAHAAAAAAGGGTVPNVGAPSGGGTPDAAPKPAAAAAAAIDPAQRSRPLPGQREEEARAAANAPGSDELVGVAEDQLLPRPVYFADELLGAGDGPTNSPGAPLPEPLAPDTLLTRGVIMGVGLGPAPTSAASGGGAAAQPAQPPSASLSPHYPPRGRRVVGLTLGHAHASFVTDDGRLWMTGMRGRGRLFDDSGEVVAEAAAAAAAGADGSSAAAPHAPLLSRRHPVHGGGGLSTSGVPVHELTVALRPVEVPLGPLAGRRVVRLRSSMHHSYALTDDGALWRWGWAGVVLPVRDAELAAPAEADGGAPGEQQGTAPSHSRLAVADVRFGYAHAMLLAARPSTGGQGSPLQQSQRVDDGGSLR